MTQKTTLPTAFTGALVSALPKFIHAAPVTAGLIRRYAAASLDSTTVGTTVGTLADLTGLGTPLAQTDPALQPTVRQSGLIRYLEFNADSMTAGAASASPQTFAVVGKYRTASNAGNWPIAALGSGGSGAFSRGSDNLMASYGSSILKGGGDPGTSWHVFLCTFAGASSVSRMDAVEATGDAGTSTGGSVILGKDTGNAATVMVDVAEVLIWNRALTLAERNKTVADLKTAYGI